MLLRLMFEVVIKSLLVKLLVLMILLPRLMVDMFPAQSVLVDVFPKNALLPRALTVEMVLVMSDPAGASAPVI
jgi:hypothetical protein